MAKTTDSPAPADEQPQMTGKGRPTPSRAQQEAARRRPLAPDTKEAKAAARARVNEARNRANDGYARGEEKYLPARDKGPQRRFARDYVDAGWHLAEFLMPAMLVVIIVTFIFPSYQVTNIAFLVLIILVIVAIGNMVILAHNIKNRLKEKYGKDRLERGLSWYIAMRAMQMRFMRMPKPQVKRGQYPE